MTEEKKALNLLKNKLTRTNCYVDELWHGCSAERREKAVQEIEGLLDSAKQKLEEVKRFHHQQGHTSA